MGVILDSSVIIFAERARKTTAQLFEDIFAIVGDQEQALSAIGFTELVHGTFRGPTNAHRAMSRRFLNEILDVLPVHPYTQATAELAGRIDAEQKTLGFHIPFPDLLIGATARSLGFSILTTNLRHFRMIPNLNVIAF